MSRLSGTPLAAMLALAGLMAGPVPGAPAWSVQRSGDTLLVSADWLAARLTDPAIIVLHVGPDSTVYRGGHIPGARFLPLRALMVEREGIANELPPVRDLIASFEAVGLGPGSRVVLYGELGGLAAARGFFALDYLGLGHRTALLDGGLEVWRADGHPLSTEPERPVPGALVPSLRPEVVARVDWVRERIGQRGLVLLDARPDAQYTGAEPGDGITRPGHLPGAVNLFWRDALVSAERPVLKDRDSLERLYRGRGIGAADTVVAYCRTGVQASHAYFVARYLGRPARMYDGSFIEWSRDPALPVESNVGVGR